jgi:transcriptional regulator with GAF, ATPase, and Fis domain
MADPGAPITDDLLSDHVQQAAAAGAAASVLQHRTDTFERDQIVEALQRAGGVKTKVAEELGLTPRGLAKKMRRLGL